MSTSLAESLAFIAQEICIYFGIPLLIVGILGGVLNIIVFLSLRTFRQSSCAFYLTIMSIVNIVQLITGLLARIMITGFGIDWTQTSLIFCKLRYFLFPIAALISFTCITLATIDQYFATCFRPHWQQWSNIQVAYRLTTIFSIIWILHGIPYLIFFNQNISPTTGKIICTSTNNIFIQYRSYFVTLVLTGVLPIVITILFGSLAYYNVRRLAYRTLPLVRRELDKQLTVMVLAQVIVNAFTILPYAILVALTLNTNLMNDPVIAIRIQFTATITTLLYYTNFGSPFFIYVCASERFRRQLIHVLFTIYFEKWQQPRMIVNQVVPEL
ncbi:unnamed protein product [Rotaria sordida]|uniref:G-protein coupled receptors family 1 profile domain-containing protein n=1 Tax=Rotaria sordida TaxID=392033 RepID=A0A815MPK6_9BILA|nr:unnamed protein product [Rotaria sordida]CAF1419071.1 unnamed protein product [Rotaria sordida]